MKLKNTHTLIILCAAFMIFVGGSIPSAAQVERKVDKITLLAAEIPGGLVKIEGTRGVGVYPDLFYEAAAISNTSITFRFVPWGRAFREVEQSEHLLTFPLTRLPEREARYKWLVPLDTDEIVFLSRDTPINSLSQAKKLKRILVWEGSSMEIFLRSKGFSNLLAVGKTESLIRMLAHGRADAWFTVRPEKMESFSANGSIVKIVSGDGINTESVWLVGGISFIHSEESRRFSQVVRNLVNKGRLKELKQKYKILPK